MKYNKFLFAMLFLFASLSIFANNYDNISSLSMKYNLEDSIPGTFFTYDTLIIFDSATYEETITVTKNEVQAQSYFTSLIFSGERKMVTDTLFVFDSSGEEGIKIVYQSLPIEILRVFKQLTDEQKDYLFNIYGDKD